jgi:hypothetical protein
MKSPETLHECPKCGTSGFTARGLKAHVCDGKNRNAKALVPATPVAVELVDETAPNRQTVADLPDDLRGAVDEAIRFHIESGLMLGRGAIYYALSGKAIASLKKKIGHGQWLPFVEAHLKPAGLPERTCRHHMQVWEAAKAKALKSTLSEETVQLLEAPLESLNEKGRAELLKIASQVCQGTNAEQLLLESGLKKEAKEKGGKREKPRDLTEEEKEAALNELAQSTFKGLYVTISQAREDQRELLLRLPVQAANPEEEVSLVHLRDTLKPLLDLLDAAIATRTALAKAA